MTDDDLVAFRQALAVRRRAGEPFDGAWDAEMAALPKPEPLSQTNPEYPTADALLAAQSAWARAYDRRPETPLGRAAARLGLLLEPKEPPLLQPVRTPPPPAAVTKAPTPAGAAAGAAARARGGWWQRAAV